MMRIVINAGDFFRDYPEVEMGRYFTDCLIRLVRSNPDSSFWCLSSPFFRSPEWTGVLLGEIGITRWLPGAPGSNPLAKRQISLALARHQIQAILTIGRPLTGRFSIPQFVWIPGNAGNNRLDKDPSLVRKVKEQPIFLIADSTAQRDFWARSYSLPQEKLRVVPLAFCESYDPLAWVDKEQIKVKYAGGKEFFLSRSLFPEKNLLTLLRAFSIFKKKQQSNMKLLIAGMAGEPNHIPFEKLESYKYRHDVHVYAGMAEADFAKMVASAYALVEPVTDHSFCSLLNAFHAQVPVISAASGDFDEKVREAIQQADAIDHEKLAEGIIALFNNEPLRTNLIRKGEVRAGLFSMQQAASILWQTISEATGH